MSVPVATEAAVSGSLGTAAGASAGAGLGGMVLALVLVVALILGLAWVLRRLPGGPLRGHGGVKLVASLPVGPRERVLVVEVGGEQLVLGATAQQVSLLHRLDTPLPSDAAPEGFASLLARRMQKDRSR